MKVITAVLITIASLASAAPNFNGALVSARQDRCYYLCSCLVRPGGQVHDDAKSDTCCFDVVGIPDNNALDPVYCTKMDLRNAEQFSKCCLETGGYECRLELGNADCPTVTV